MSSFDVPYSDDSLTSEDHWDERFDVILANPPFMTPKGGIRPHNRFAVKAKKSEVLFVDYIAEHLNPQGRAGVIIPDGVITGKGSANKALQKLLVDQYCLEAVISLPAGVFQPYARAKTSILLFSSGRQTENVWFCEMSADGFTMDDRRQPCALNDIPAILSRWETKENSDSSVSVPVHTIRSLGYDLRIGRYPPLEVVDKSEAGFDVNQALTELTEFSRTPVQIPPHTGIQTTLATTTLGRHLAITQRPITLEPEETYQLLGVKWYGEGPFLRETLKGAEIGAAQLFQVREGDILYNRLFAWKGSFGVIPAELDGCFVSNEFPIFRIKDGSDVDAGFIKYYLKCPTVWKIAERLSTGTSSTSRNRFAIPDFLALPYPDMSKDKQKAFVAAIARLDELRSRARVADELCGQTLDKWITDFGPWVVSGWGQAKDGNETGDQTDE